MGNTFVAVITTIAALIVLYGVFGVIQSIREHFKERAEREEREGITDEAWEDEDAIRKGGPFVTADGDVHGLLGPHGNLEWIQVIGRPKRASLEELFQHDSMSMNSYEELSRMDLVLKEYKRTIHDARTYIPPYRKAFEVTPSRTLYVYREGPLAVDDGLIVKLEYREDKIEVTEAIIAPCGVNGPLLRLNLDTEEGKDQYSAFLAKHEGVNERVQLLQEDLDFYNLIIPYVTFDGNRVIFDELPASLGEEFFGLSPGRKPEPKIDDYRKIFQEAPRFERHT